ncbi:MAG TPA: hypothetical protein VLL05_16985 [Terriglobales bacterium]|nr:hypothetical protein [Terriglobales bacterium]
MTKSLNQAYSTRSTRRRYEAWFLRLGLADGSGGWWFRYLLMNPARSGCPGQEKGLPVQVWATWFPAQGRPLTLIQGFPVANLHLNSKASPFRFQIGENVIEENSCQGSLQVDEHSVSWDLHYDSTFCVTLSAKGWIGFTRTPHSDARFSGSIVLDGARFEASPLGFGVQGHNCGYRHRNFWTWTHAYFLRPNGRSSTLEALVYEMPLGLVFRKAILWHGGVQHVFRKLEDTTRDREPFAWSFQGHAHDGLELEATIDGSGPSMHVLSYVKTDCTGVFQVSNNSLARARLRLTMPGGLTEMLETSNAVLEKAGDY